MAAEFRFGAITCKIFIPTDGLRDYTAIERSFGLVNVNILDSSGTATVPLSMIKPGEVYIVTGVGMKTLNHASCNMILVVLIVLRDGSKRCASRNRFGYEDCWRLRSVS